MKRILGLLAVALFINACDDGDLTVDTIDFADVSIQKCPQKDILYKISDNKMLILAIPATTFVNDETPDNDPIEVQISGNIEVVYRQYNGTPTDDNICDVVTAATPNLSEEWNATSGTILITSTAIKTVNSTTGITQITGYRHYIVFEDIVFLKPDGTTQTYAGNSFVFGNYNATQSPLAFGFNEEAAKSTCAGDNRIFNFNSSEAFVLDLADFGTLFQNEVTTTPRTALISSTNKVVYKLFSGTINNDYFCTIPAPVTPTLNQEWTANYGDATAGTGIIEVSTTTSTPGFFLHTIRLKKVTMTKGNSDFYLGNDYLYGTIITP
ncbi:hypothetical protein IVB69_04235 [Flavobacterium sp. J49]|uniref:hypothetical protein n=1 Tax=Flavobacterium sp. J49 TaxID=2718534 RepID=UPI0015932A07|nr:hypothetical protein [Flavobacterium sp. J49]MBF6640678.1 hypothetical protein [Flavobacterium sp. J49]NIC01925.1 hypothetical protein [Flavobacterium sp. J49]